MTAPHSPIVERTRERQPTPADGRGRPEAGHPGALAARTLAADVARRYGDALLRTARRYAGDPDDAHDAYQRALELLMEHAGSIDPDKVLPWMHVVVRREAGALRRRHDRHLPLDVDAVDHHFASRSGADQTEEQLERIDLAQRAGEALAALKETEAQALCLRAQGLSYEEIAEAYDWSYTKVNRAVTEGRRAFVEHYRGVESGEVCAHTDEHLDRYLEGKLRGRAHMRVHAHLRRCPSCRAQLHAGRQAERALAALLPPIGPLTGGGPRGWFHAHVLDPASDLATRVWPAGEHVAAAKVGTVAAAVAVAAGGGVVAERKLSAPAHEARVQPAFAAGSPGGEALRGTLDGAVDRQRKIVRIHSERAAAERRVAAAERRRAIKTAASREFTPAASEFSGGGSAASGTGSRAAEAAAPPVEVPVDTGGGSSTVDVVGDSPTP